MERITIPSGGYFTMSNIQREEIRNNVLKLLQTFEEQEEDDLRLLDDEEPEQECECDLIASTLEVLSMYRGARDRLKVWQHENQNEDAEEEEVPMDETIEEAEKTASELVDMCNEHPSALEEIRLWYTKSKEQSKDIREVLWMQRD